MLAQTKICVTDSDLCELEALEKLFNDAGFAVSTFQTGRQLISHLDAADACCIVFDAHLPDVDPHCLLDALSARQRYVPVVFIAFQPMISSVVQLMKRGAADILAKPCSHDALLAAVRDASQRHALESRNSDALDFIERRYKTLTSREKQIFQLVVAGMLNKQVAGELGIAEKTVKVHRGRVMKKLGAQSVVELVRMADKRTALQPQSFRISPDSPDIQALASAQAPLR